MSALAADAIVGTVLTFVGLKGLMPLRWWQTLAVFGYAMVSCLVLNDAVKVAMIKWRVPNAVAVKAVDASPQIAKAEPKPAAKNEPQPGAKAETKSEAKPVPPPENKGEAAPEAKGAPQPDAKVAPPAQVKAGPEPDDNTDVAKVMNTTLGGAPRERQ
jgi:hypothetical protein